MKQIGPNCFIYGHMKQRRRHLTDFNNSSPKYSIQIVYFKARSTLIRFQTKTELICVHTYRFRIVFARPHYNAVSVLKTLLYPQERQERSYSNWDSFCVSFTVSVHL